MDEFVQDFGFENAAEFNRMVAAVNLAKPGGIERFKQWQDNDGTKAGLERLLQESKP